MDTTRDEVQEELLGDIIARGSDAVCSLFLNDTDGLEAAGYDYDGSSDLMPVQEGDREDGSCLLCTRRVELLARPLSAEGCNLRSAHTIRRLHGLQAHCLVQHGISLSGIQSPYMVMTHHQSC